MLFTNFIYYVFIGVLLSGLYIIITNDNYFRKIIGLGIFQNAVLIFYIALSKIAGGVIPFTDFTGKVKIVAPVPHVLMLTAIVVGFATLSVGIALIFRIQEEFDTVQENKIDITHD